MKRLIFAVLAALVLLPATAMAKDGNHDGLPDRWEHQHHLSTHHAQGGRDQDHDGLRNRAEFKHHTDPRDADTDNDGIDDGDEVRFGFRPKQKDHAGDAGTVKSFDSATGTLVISLLKGDEVSALVTDATKVECDASGHATAQASDRGADSGDEGDDDHGGPHGTRGDDDHGDDPSDDQGDDQGDDNGNADDASCTTAALTAGALVRRARLEVDGGQAVWTKLKLVG